jgi:hypothetical protein
MNKFILFLLAGIFSPLWLFAQFKLNGYAQYMETGCVLLTPDERYAEGIAYSTERINLDKYFEIEFDIYLGDKDEFGADGITFVIHNDPREFEAFGTYGECIGYGRWDPEVPYGTFIAPSIAVEFDTYQNPRQGDPTGDHVAYLENGVSFHESYWNGGNESLNLEDDRLHSFRFSWNPEKKEIIILLDNNIVHKGKRDVINDIFQGKTSVIWGFTASTGNKHNTQYFCIKRIAVEDILIETPDFGTEISLVTV